jgi:uncharacterized protein YqgV (UPF0045/DUF77 family)
MALAKRLHFRLFDLGAHRVSTTPKIDERTDQQLTLEGKAEAVRRKMG